MKHALLLLILALLLSSCIVAPVPPTPTPVYTPEMLIVPPDWKTATPLPIGKTIRINGVNPGEYGRTVTLGGAETNTYIGYFLPSGWWEATNNRNYQDQLNVYSVKTEMWNGYEYPDEGESYLFKPGETQTIYVPYEYYVKIVHPSDFTMTMTKINFYEPAPTQQFYR